MDPTEAFKALEALRAARQRVRVAEQARDEISIAADHAYAQFVHAHADELAQARAVRQSILLEADAAKKLAEEAFTATQDEEAKTHLITPDAAYKAAINNQIEDLDGSELLIAEVGRNAESARDKILHPYELGLTEARQALRAARETIDILTDPNNEEIPSWT